MIGMADEGLGTATVVLDLDTDPDTIGKILAAGFRTAHAAAIRDVRPKLTTAWVEQPDRLREGDSPPE